MKILSYSKINESPTSREVSFKSNLYTHYKEEPIETNLTNQEGTPFLLFINAIEPLENKFNELIDKALHFREGGVSEYLKQGYVVSEINSSLRAEGVNSSRKIVEQVIKNKLSGNKLKKDELTKLISNYYDALSFITSNKEITERNIHTLYGMLTADLSDVIEFGKLYREGDVTIGQDKGVPSSIISTKIKELIAFIDSGALEDKIQTKAIISHYIFENIHPYYDYNGRMGRILHLWVLINHSRDEFWKLIFLSESIYAFKEKLDTTFRKITKAKKQKSNIDLTFFVGNLYEIFIDHTTAYIKMKDMTNEMPKKASRHLRLFLIDLLCLRGADGKWYDINEFKKRYPDYSPTVSSRVLKEIRDSTLFQIREGKPIQFRLK
ncbi:Fic family protein [Mycoplasma marinum]|nr:Fic family protein [Mycoplasma marinum]